MQRYTRIFKEELSGEWWIDRDGNATFADGNVGDSDHAVIVLQALMSEILDIFNAKPVDDFVDETEFYANIHDALELSKEEELMWEDGDWQGVMNLKLPANFDKKKFGKMMDTMNGNFDARDFGKQYYGWIRLKGNQIDLWELTESSLRALSNGIYDAYDEDSYDQNYDIELFHPKHVYLTNVPYPDIESHDVKTVMSHNIRSY